MINCHLKKTKKFQQRWQSKKKECLCFRMEHCEVQKKRIIEIDAVMWCCHMKIDQVYAPLASLRDAQNWWIDIFERNNEIQIFAPYVNSNYICLIMPFIVAFALEDSINQRMQSYKRNLNCKKSLNQLVLYFLTVNY